MLRRFETTFKSEAWVIDEFYSRVIESGQGFPPQVFVNKGS